MSAARMTWSKSVLRERMGWDNLLWAVSSLFPHHFVLAGQIAAEANDWQQSRTVLCGLSQLGSKWARYPSASSIVRSKERGCVASERIHQPLGKHHLSVSLSIFTGDSLQYFSNVLWVNRLRILVAATMQYVRICDVNCAWPSSAIDRCDGSQGVLVEQLYTASYFERCWLLG